ncbi:hypothetical protein LXL04_003277 [Taraxacum kok-saghyz]
MMLEWKTKRPYMPADLDPFVGTADMDLIDLIYNFIKECLQLGLPVGLCCGTEELKLRNRLEEFGESAGLLNRKIKGISFCWNIAGARNKRLAVQKERLIRIRDSMSADQGDPTDRVAFYFVEALHSRITKKPRHFTSRKIENNIRYNVAGGVQSHSQDLLRTHIFPRTRELPNLFCFVSKPLKNTKFLNFFYRSLYNTYLKSCTYAKVKKKYRFFGNFFQRIVMIKNVLEGSEVGFLKGITVWEI